MKNEVQVTLSVEVFERLQKLATPLVDNTNSVLIRLLDFWETNQTTPKPSEQALRSEYWVAARGERLPVGMKLRGTYLGKAYEAEITTKGICVGDRYFDSPSNAGIHVKIVAGTKGKAASTNGWTFWQYYDQSRSKWVELRLLRK
jgi:hypothetical protein